MTNEDFSRRIAEGFNQMLWSCRDKLGIKADGRISLGFTSELSKSGGFSTGTIHKVECFYNSRGIQTSLFIEKSKNVDDLVEMVSHKLFSIIKEEMFDKLIKDELH